MNTLSPASRAFVVVSTLGMCLLIATALTRFSATTMPEWVLLLTVWLIPGAGIVFTERRATRSGK
jgi:hypothetical protein